MQAKLTQYALAAFVIVVIGGAIGGWVWNIAKIFGAASFSGTVVARVLGVLIPPVGAIMGWF